MMRKIADPMEFARAQRRAEVGLTLAHLPRVAEVWFAQAPEPNDEIVHAVIEGRVEENPGLNRRSFLEIGIRGNVVLECQRCLQSLDYPLDLHARLELIPPGQPLPDDALENDESDAVYAERDLDLPVLLEDEILLSLPLVARHEACALKGLQNQTQQDTGASELESKKSPFAALAKLKTK